MRVPRFAAAAVVVVLGSCSGQTCLQPLPSGFPSSARTSNSTQARITNSGVGTLAAFGQNLAKQLLGPTQSINPRPQCTSSTPLCCPGGVPDPACGPVTFDTTLFPGDQPRVELRPIASASRIDVTLRARVTTTADLPVTIPISGACGVRIDTLAGTVDDIRIDFPLTLTQDPISGTTRATPGTVVVSQLTSEDVALTGPFGCQLANLGLSFYISTLTDIVSDAIRTNLASSFCKTCPSGSAMECGPFATACTDGVCMQAMECVHELGLSGRLTSEALFSSVTGSLGALDLYEVAGGYATTNANGVALGVLAGMVPSGSARDRCGPAATPPTPPMVPVSTFFQNNTRPDTGAPFQFGIGFHVSQLEQFAFAAYEGGALCANSNDVLRSPALAATAPSLANLTLGDRPLTIGFRPQAPPVVTLGRNQFDVDGGVLDPLVTLDFTGAEFDLFTDVEQQPIRVLTAVADVDVPLAVWVDELSDGGSVLAPVLVDAGITNVSIRNSEPLQESSATLTPIGAQLIDAALPDLVTRLGPIRPPHVLGLSLDVQEVTSVEGLTFLALFANFDGDNAAKRSSGGGGPVKSAGVMSAPSSSPHPAVFVAFAAIALVFLLRRRWVWAGAVFLVALACGPMNTAPDGGTGGGSEMGGGSAVSGGGSAMSGGGAATGGGSAMSGGGSAMTGGGSTMGGGGSAMTGGGSTMGGGSATGGGSACGAMACLPGQVTRGGLGQWNSVASGTRTVISTYDARLGDLVLVERINNVETTRAIDGVPAVTPIYEPTTYRGGIDVPGPDVGAWTSVKLSSSNRVVIAYQDRDRAALRVAIEQADGSFLAHDVDDSTTGTVDIGTHASLAFSGTIPSIAYLATGVGSTPRTELRLANASSAAPTSSSDWTTTVVAFADAPAPTSGEFARGPGLFVSLLALTDGRRVLVHFDSARGALLAHVENAAGSLTFTQTVLDGAPGRGKWASAVVDATDLVHVAYQDERTHEVYALTFRPGMAPSTPELIDDGVRMNDRAHPVGAGLVMWLDPRPRVAYQDAFTADVIVATKATGVWSHTVLTPSVALDGFHLAAPAQGTGPLVWDQVSSASAGSHQLIVNLTP
ncbi:MAG: hypothetical protein JNM17_33470 [Archangium sp.]|nr:hypothetical protein [Archangium sp.]